MSAQAAYKYADYGAEAYALPRTEVFPPAAEPKAIPDTRTGVKTAPRARTKARAEVQTRYSISLFGVTGFLLVTVLMVFVVLANIKLSEVSFQNVELEAQMQTLETEERQLLIQYEQAFDINQIETYATTVLGMTKPTEGQVGQIDLTRTDKIVILGEDGEEPSPLRGFGAFLRSLVEYFG